MQNTELQLCSRKHLNLQIQLIINRELYSNNKILKDTYLRVEQDILKDIEQEKLKCNK